MPGSGSGERPIVWLSAETPSSRGGGGERRQYHLARVLLQAGLELQVGALSGPQDDSTIRATAPVTRFGAPRLGGLRRDPALRSLLDRTRPAAAIVSHIDTVPFVDRELRARRIPTLIDLHNVLSRHRRDLADLTGAARAEALERATLSWVEAATVCSVEEREALLSHGCAVPIHVVPHGVDPVEWPEVAPKQRGDPVVAFFGTLDYPPNRDGVEWLVTNVWPRILREAPKARLWILGPGSPPPPAHQAPRVSVLGRVDDLASVLAGARVVVVPSLWGPGARVKFVEALASGAAVVSTSVGAEGYDAAGGFRSADGPADFATACLDLLRSPARALDLGAAGRRIALEKYTWDRTAEPIVAWVLNARRRAGS